jgi:hypothetical protein
MEEATSEIWPWMRVLHLNLSLKADGLVFNGFKSPNLAETDPLQALVLDKNWYFCICKILPEDGPYRPKHVVMIQV